VSLEKNKEEMKANELRIGNFINDLEDRYDPNIYVVARIESSEYTSWNSGEEYNVIASCLDPEKKGYFEIRPHGIPLTEEWLLKFGFEKIKNNGIDYELHDCVISFEAEWMWISESKLNEVRTLIPKHVHQLQNLYFALTGKELELIENKC
jgi:hypothetical protein